MKNLLINGMAHRSHLYHYDILNHKSNYDQFVANNHQCDPKSLQTLYQQSFDCIVSSFFSFSFLQGLQSSLLRPSWQNTHSAVQSGASDVLLRNFSKIIPFHRILQRHVHTQQYSKEDPLHDVYPAPDRLDPNRYPNENVNVLYQLLYQNGFHTIYTSKVYHQISQDLLSKDDNEPALPSTNTKNSSPNTSTISLH